MYFRFLNKINTVRSVVLFTSPDMKQGVCLHVVLPHCSLQTGLSASFYLPPPTPTAFPLFFTFLSPLRGPTLDVSLQFVKGLTQREQTTTHTHSHLWASQKETWYCPVCKQWGLSHTSSSSIQGEDMSQQSCISVYFSWRAVGVYIKGGRVQENGS